MANPYSQVNRVYQPYVPAYNSELAMQALAFKQQKYDANAMQIQNTLDQITNFDLVKEEDRLYMYEKAKAVLDDVNKYAKRNDLGSMGVATSIKNNISSIVDQTVLNGVAGSANYRRYQNEVAWYKQNRPEQYSALNEAFGAEGFVNWLNDGQAGSRPASGTYMPYVDIDERQLKTFKDMRIGNKGYTIQQQELDQNGHPTGRIVERVINQLTPIEARDILRTSFTAEEQQQLSINAWGAARSNPEAFSEQNVTAMIKDRTAAYDENILAIEAELSAAGDNSEAKADATRRLNSVREQRNQFIQQSDFRNANGEFDSMSAARFITTEGTIDRIAQRVAYNNSSYKLKTDDTHFKWIDYKQKERFHADRIAVDLANLEFKKAKEAAKNKGKGTDQYGIVPDTVSNAATAYEKKDNIKTFDNQVAAATIDHDAALNAISVDIQNAGNQPMFDEFIKNLAQKPENLGKTRRELIYQAISEADADTNFMQGVDMNKVVAYHDSAARLKELYEEEKNVSKQFVDRFTSDAALDDLYKTSTGGNSPAIEGNALIPSPVREGHVRRKDLVASGVLLRTLGGIGNDGAIVEVNSKLRAKLSSVGKLLGVNIDADDLFEETDNGYILKRKTAGEPAVLTFIRNETTRGHEGPSVGPGGVQMRSIKGLYTDEFDKFFDETLNNAATAMYSTNPRYFNIGFNEKNDQHAYKERGVMPYANLEALYMTVAKDRTGDLEEDKNRKADVVYFRKIPGGDTYELNLAKYPDNPVEVTAEELINAKIPIDQYAEMNQTARNTDPPPATRVRLLDGSASVYSTASALGFDPAAPVGQYNIPAAALFGKDAALDAMSDLDANHRWLWDENGNPTEQGQIFKDVVNYAQDLFVLDPKGNNGKFWMYIYAKDEYNTKTGKPNAGAKPIMEFEMNGQYWEQSQKAYQLAPQMYLMQAIFGVQNGHYDAARRNKPDSGDYERMKAVRDRYIQSRR
jgi:hypothetical protein